MAKVLVNKSNGLFDLRSLYDWFKSVCDGLYRIEVKRVRKPRSNDQNGWLWGYIYPMLLDALIDAGWDFVNVEQVHEFFKSQMTADKVANDDTKKVLDALFGKVAKSNTPNLDDYKSIKTYEDACEALEITPILSEDRNKDLCAEL